MKPSLTRHEYHLFTGALGGHPALRSIRLHADAVYQAPAASLISAAGTDGGVGLPPFGNPSGAWFLIPGGLTGRGASPGRRGRAWRTSRTAP